MKKLIRDFYLSCNNQGELERFFGIPIYYEPIPKDRKWNYEKIINRSLEERKMIGDSWQQRVESINNAK